MRPAVLLLMYNQTQEQLFLTKQAVASVAAQDIGPMDICLCNNGSTAPTQEWLDTIPLDGYHNIRIVALEQNESPVKLTNDLCGIVFKTHDKVLAVANDCVLPANFYRLCDQWPRGSVSGSPVSQNPPPIVESARAVSEQLPTCAILIRKWAHDALVATDGYYLDPRFFHYCVDLDLALRAAAIGIRGVRLDLPFYHYGSASWRMLPPEQARKITDQADRDREYFRAKWGVSVNDYGPMLSDLNFRGRYEPDSRLSKSGAVPGISACATPEPR